MKYKKIIFKLITLSIIGALTTINPHISKACETSSMESIHAPLYEDTEENRALYNEIYKAILNKDEFYEVSIDRPATYEDAKGLESISNKVIKDHPELYSYLTICDIEWGGNSYGLDFAYQSLDKVEECNKKVDSIISSIIDPAMTNIEKEIAIHNYLIANCKYDHAEHFDMESTTAYGAIVKNKALCGGYSMAFTLLLSRVNILSEVVFSSDYKHAWNIVNIDGERYHVDITWDDTEYGFRYLFFNKSDEDMRDGNPPHNWNADEYEKCTSNKYRGITYADYEFMVDNNMFFPDASDRHFKSVNLDDGSIVDYTALGLPDTSEMDLQTYHNGWIYYSDYNKADSKTTLCRSKISDLSNKEELGTMDNIAIELHVKDGQALYNNLSGEGDVSIPIPNYNKYDLNGDDSVDAADLGELALHYNRKAEFLYTKQNQDLNDDGIVDIYDLCALSSNMDEE